MKYVIMICLTSGKIELIACETLELAEICFKALREQSNIIFASLHQFEKSITEIN